MKFKNKITFWAGLGGMALISNILFYACKPEVTKGGLGNLPEAAFKIVPDATNPNHLTLINTTATPSIPSWKTSTGANIQGDSARVNFVFAGSYTITLYVAGHGGIDSVTQPVTIAQSDPNACVGTTFGFIAGCTSRTWKLNPAAGAMGVGPSGPGDISWWQNTAGDVTGRAGDFDDTYTFSFNAAGTYVFNDGGDFYSDGYMGTIPYTTQNDQFYTDAQKAWSSGTFSYVFIPGTGAKKLGQIELVGLGAHLGLPKVTNAAETTSGPVATSITYDIISMSTDSDGHSHLQLSVNTGGTEWWTFNLISVN